MTDTARTSSQSAIPVDDPKRKLTVVNPDDPEMRYISLAGDTYTILLTGKDTDGRYCLIDMYVPPGGGPPPHRHDFEEMFTVLDGEIEITFRDGKKRASAGSTVNIPANAPHSFTRPRRSHPSTDRSCSFHEPRLLRWSWRTLGDPSSR